MRRWIIECAGRAGRGIGRVIRRRVDSGSTCCNIPTRTTRGRRRIASRPTRRWRGIASRPTRGRRGIASRPTRGRRGIASRPTRGRRGIASRPTWWLGTARTARWHRGWRWWLTVLLVAVKVDQIICCRYASILSLQSVHQQCIRLG